MAQVYAISDVRLKSCGTVRLGVLARQHSGESSEWPLHLRRPRTALGASFDERRFVLTNLHPYLLHCLNQRTCIRTKVSGKLQSFPCCRLAAPLFTSRELAHRPIEEYQGICRRRHHGASQSLDDLHSFVFSILQQLRHSCKRLLCFYARLCI